MENIEAKAAFLKAEYTALLAKLDPNAARLWGKMNVQQMVEHMADYVRIGSGRTPVRLLTPEENVPRMQAFLSSEKPFKENTPNAVLPDEPLPAKRASMKEAIEDLQAELDHFFEVFKNEPGKKVTNLFFGDLDYDMSVQLLYKHVTHHLRQFGAM